MKRYPDWQLRLEEFVKARSSAPFAWGINDCAFFAADAVQAMTGEHLCPELREYSGAREAVRALAAVGGVEALATRALGEPIPVPFARVGDVVTIQAGKREALAICNGQTAIAPYRGGVLAVPMSQALSAWRVG